MSYYEPDSQKALFGNGVLWLVGILIVVALITAAVFGIKWVTAPVRGKAQARETIYSGNNRIVQYEKFFDLCTSVQTAEQTIIALKEQLKNTTNEDDKTTIATNITANISSRADAVNEYNNNSHKNYNEAKFKASNLPYSLSITIPEGGTKCAY